jgi:hypothetical protein
MPSNELTLSDCELWTIRYLTMLAEKLAHGLAIGSVAPHHIAAATAAIARLSDGAEHVAQNVLDRLPHSPRADQLVRSIEAMVGDLDYFAGDMPTVGSAPTKHALPKLLDSARVIGARARSEPPASPPSRQWVAQAYPLQQITIKLQGTRHSELSAVVGQVNKVVARIKANDLEGEESDHDFGYVFEVNVASAGPSFFDAPASIR